MVCPQRGMFSKDIRMCNRSVFGSRCLERVRANMFLGRNAPKGYKDA